MSDEAVATGSPVAQQSPAAAEVEQSQSQAATPQKTQSQEDDDPEFDLGDVGRLKRSELSKIIKSRKDFERGAYMKMQEAAKARKEAEAIKAEAQRIKESFGSDLEAQLRAIGVDPDEWAEKRLAQKLEEHRLTPEQREARAQKEELDRLRAEKAEMEKQQQQRQYDEQVSKYQQYYDQQFSDAIITSGLPKTATTLKRMAEKAELYWGSGLQVPLDIIAAEVKDDIKTEKRELIKSLKDDDLLDFYDDDEREAIRKLLVKQAKLQPPAQPNENNLPKRKNKPLTLLELQERAAKRAGRIES